MKSLSSPAWLPKQTRGTNISTDIHVDWNHSTKQNIANYGVNLPKRNARVFKDAESFYSIVTGQDMAKYFQSAIDCSIPELLRLEIALYLMKKRTNYFMPYKYSPNHMLMDRLCTVISECAFEVVLLGNDPGSPLKLKEIPFAEYESSNQYHVSVHEIAFAAYGDSSSYEKIPPPMLLFDLDTNKELRPATLKMKIAYESAKKREKMELMTRTAQRSNRRWSTPFVPFRTRAFNKLLEAKCNEGKCHYPVVYSQDREMHELIIDAIAWRIDVILGKDAMEHPYAIEQKFDSLMRFYKDSVNAWPICDGRGAMFTFDYTEVHDVEAIYKPYISTTDQSDAEKGEGERYFLHHYRQGILSSFIENLDAADNEFETVYPIYGKGRIYDRSDSSAEEKDTMIDDAINFPAPDLTRVFETFETNWGEVIDKFQVQSETTSRFT